MNTLIIREYLIKNQGCKSILNLERPADGRETFFLPAYIPHKQTFSDRIPKPLLSKGKMYRVIIHAFKSRNVALS